MKFQLGVLAAVAMFVTSCASAQALTVTVNSAADTPGSCPGPSCTLRAAIQSVDGSSDTSNEIDFAGPLTVFYTSFDPAITRPVTINGCDQCGIDGSLAGIDASGLRFDSGSSGSVVRNLDIVNFQGAAVQVQGGATGVTVLDCILGLGRKGNPAPNFDGVLVTAHSGAFVGGSAAADRNVISANTQAGIAFDGSSLQAHGNLIGTSLDGTRAEGNEIGVDVQAPGATIGGPGPGDGNVISGSAGATPALTACSSGPGQTGRSSSRTASGRMPQARRRSQTRARGSRPLLRTRRSLRI
jgi:CSLREA domain-containing protein